MKDKLLEKINNNEYISNYLYMNVINNDKSFILNGFDIDKHNESVLDKEYNKYKDYFLSMYKGIDDSILLDEDQIKTILSDEDYALILAGAGTGKTTTMVSLVKYLVDIKKVEPSKICVMSYSRKTTEELQDRINIDFSIPAKVSTFHSLGYSYIREIYNNRKCYVVDDNKKTEIFMKYFKEYVFNNNDKVDKIINNFSIIKKRRRNSFILGKYFLDHYKEYDNFDEYFKDYKIYRLEEAKKIDLKKIINDKINSDINLDTPVTINLELVKSKGEAIIANYLYSNGINYEYEKIYKELLDDSSIYRPDFTLELNGEFVYLEYFGLSSDQNKNRRYESIKKKKEEMHRKKNNKFISISYMNQEDIIKKLEYELRKYGFIFKPRSDEEIFLRMLDGNPCSQMYPFKEFLYNTINKIKSSQKREIYDKLINKYLDTMIDRDREEAVIQFEIIDEFYKFYQKELYGSEEYGFDYSDMIYYASKYIDYVYNENKFSFEYLIIDEYQDISMERYLFTKKIVNKNNSKIIAVGDDWQSIYSFSGSNIEYTYNFLKYFEGAKELKISRTYRNSQELTNYSSSFILKNKSQMKKELFSYKENGEPIKFCYFDDGYEYEMLKKLILNIHKENPDDRILILGRTNDIINQCYNDGDLIDDIGTKVKFVGYEDIDIDAMTIHKSKGLTSDQVIVIGLSDKFPIDNFKSFWLDDIFGFKVLNEKIAYPEERRLFYVALTRTKNNVYLLVNNDPMKRSPFIEEIMRIISDSKVNDDKDNNNETFNNLFKLLGLNDRL